MSTDVQNLLFKFWFSYIWFMTDGNVNINKMTFGGFAAVTKETRQQTQWQHIVECPCLTVQLAQKQNVIHGAESFVRS
jgi:hypothetical protein